MGKDHKKLQNNLEALRKSAGLTQQELSESAEVSRKSINAIENGIYVPSTVLALKIANKLNCSVEDLFKLPWCKGYDLQPIGTIGYGGIVQSSDLKGENYGRVGSNGFCFWNGRSGSTGSVGKINKDFKRKRNSRRELQGRVNHYSEQLSHCRVDLNSDLKRRELWIWKKHLFLF